METVKILGKLKSQGAYGAIPEEEKLIKDKTKSGCFQSLTKFIKTPRVSTPMKICLVVSFSFFFRFTASMAIQSLQSSLNKEAYLGVVSLSVMYGTIIIGAPLAPALIRLIGLKNVLIIAWGTYLIYIVCNFYPTWATLIPSSALVGAVAGPLFTAQGFLISFAGESYAKLSGSSTDEALHAALSKFNGIFFMFFEVSGVSGNMISSLVLFSDVPKSSNSSEDKMCGIYASESYRECSNSTCNLEIEEPDNYVVFTLLSVFLVCTLIALLIIVFGLSNKDLSESKPDLPKNDHKCSSLSSSLTMAIDKRMVVLLPLFMAQGMVLGFLDGDYTRDFISCTHGIHWVGYTMAAFRMFCAIFAISINCLAHHVGRFILFYIAIFADTAVLIAMLLWSPRPDDHIALFFIIPVVSGLADGIMLPQFATLLAQVFSDNKTSAFAIYHTARAASLSITFALSTFVCLRYRLYIAICLYLLGLAGFTITELRIRRQFQDDNRQKLSKDYKDNEEIDSTIKGPIEGPIEKRMSHSDTEQCR